jgi:hypothetical protein
MTQYVRPGETVPTSADIVLIDAPVPGSIAGVNQIVVGGPLAQTIAYHHTQNTSSNTWVINHGLNFFPNVTVADSSGSLCEGEIAYTDNDSLTITFSKPFSGVAYLS